MDETVEVTQEVENETGETVSSVADVSDDTSTDILAAGEDQMESETDPVSTPSVSASDDILDAQTFNEGVDEIIAAIQETESDDIEITGSGVSFYAAVDPLALQVPDNQSVFYLGDTQLVIPSDLSDDFILQDGFLINLGSSSVTICADLSDTASVSNYYTSQITIPSYMSSNYVSYIANYGYPYMIVDRYYESGYLRSVTRDSSAAMMAETITQSDWYGISGWRMYGFIFAVVLIFLMIWRSLRWKLT